MKTSDIPEKPILEWLALNQGSWSFLGSNGLESLSHPEIGFCPFPEWAGYKLKLSKMRSLHKRGLVGGCPCGCRGDFEITDKGLALIGVPRTKPYNGY